MSTHRFRVAVVGARRRRQGTGEFVARELAAQGCGVCAVVGTSEASVQEAKQVLQERYGISPAGYTSLEALLAEAQVDAVAICSPYTAHLGQLEQAVAAGCHVFCEKPLWWNPELAEGRGERAEIETRAGRILDTFRANRRSLAINAQWPFTLDAFRSLHPEAYGTSCPVETFSMSLAPDSRGLEMVVDAGSHLISMLQALAGPGAMSELRTVSPDGGQEKMTLSGEYQHESGRIGFELKLSRCPDVPRPAGYGINGKSVERVIELPNYAISFAANGKSVPVRDPLACSVGAFLESARAGRPPDRASVVDGMTLLHDMVMSARSTEDR